MDNHYSVLFVDDEVNILASLKRGFVDEEYMCFFASSGPEALEILKNEKISVIVTDMRMPGMDGLTLLKEVRLKYPTTVRIVLTGYTQIQQVLATINQVDVFKFITKPWKLEEEFKVVISQALDFYRLQEERNELESALINKNIAYQNILKNMEEVLEDAKKNANGLRQLGKAAFNRLLKFGSADGADCMKENVKKAERIFGKLADAFSEQSKSILLLELCNDMNEKVKEIPGILNIKTVMKIQPEIRIKAKTDMLKIFVMGLIEALLEILGKCNIKLMFEGKVLEPSEVLFECAAALSKSEADMHISTEGNTHAMGPDIEMISDMFSTLALYNGGNLAFGKSDEGIIFKAVLKFKQC